MAKTRLSAGTNAACVALLLAVLVTAESLICILGAMNSPDAVSRLNIALEGRYRIEREIGKGGMATVYLADDLKHERKVALR